MDPQSSTRALSQPLSNAELAELDELLASVPEDRDPLDVTMLDGFLAGVLLQPDTVLPSAWLPLVFDAEGREVTFAGDHATIERIVGLVMRRFNELAAHIAAREPFDPIVFELEDDERNVLAGKDAIGALEPWVAGFMNALSAFPALLDRLDSSEAGGDALTGILRHLPVDPDDTSDEALLFARDKAAMEQEVPLADLDHAIDELVACVMDIADVARPRRPMARTGPKVGRNDPCPCGSGRKFKNCHGHSSVH
jgi:uncharacterized protein